jgi:hypothetical protein
MADQLQLRGGTTAEHASFTGALREVTVDIDKDTVVVHDNTTAGGHPLAKEDLSNVSAATTATKLANQTVAFNGGAAATPSVTFNGDTNTGIYSPGADQLAISTNGTGRLFVDANGNLTNTRAIATAYSATNAATWANGLSLYNSSASAPGVSSFINFTGVSNVNSVFGVTQAGSSYGDFVWASFNGSFSERMRLDASGRLGLGTSSADGMLHVKGSNTHGSLILEAGGTSGSTNQIYLQGHNNAGAAIGEIAFDETATNQGGIAFKTNGGSLTTKMTLTSGGSLGIGTTSLTEKLHVDGNIVTKSGDYGILFGDSTCGINGDTTSDYIKIYTANAERARIDSSGRLLVGTSTSRAQAAINLPVFTEGTSYTGFGAVYNANNTNGAFLGLSKSRGTSNGSNTIVQSGDQIGEIFFSAADGTDLETRAANIQAVVDGTPSANTMPGRLVFSTTSTTPGASPTERMRISQNGEFNCYTGSNNGFSVRTSAGAGTGAYIYQGFNNASSTTTGTVVYRVYSNGTYATISDATQKKNISTARDGYLEDLNALRVVKYHWNEQDDSEQKELGLIAQEVETVFPGLIAEFDSDAGETIKGIKSSVLTFMLIKALQEATGRIETLEAEIVALKAQ